AALAHEYEAWRAARGDGYDDKRASEIIIKVAPHLGAFIARLFRIPSEHAALERRALDEGRVVEWKKRVLDKRVLKPHPKPEELAACDLAALESAYREVVKRTLGE